MNLAWILGDQLSPSHSAIQKLNPKTDGIIMVESLAHAKQLRHHKFKLALCFSAMRHFRDELKASGFRVFYYELDDHHTFLSALQDLISREPVSTLYIMEPHEKATDDAARALQQQLPCTVTITPNSLFLTNRQDFITRNRGKKHLVMEPFYRAMRKSLSILMEKNGTPVGGEWNFDKDNRHPAKPGTKFPKLYHPPHDAIDSEVFALVERHFPDHPGDLRDFHLPTSRKEAERFFEHFVTHRLGLFGKYEDAMLAEEVVLYHSLISPLINIGLLDTMTMVRRVEAAYHDGIAPINSAEGFIRQLIGWREFIYGCYWLKMNSEDYHKANALKHHEALPEFYWTGETAMNCVSQVVKKVLRYAYSHHIERLMILGNFALLYGVNPEQINRWFWEFYADSYDWVVTPNVIGMSQFADGGLVATKPYAASANYISKMSNYCQSCHYSKTERTGPRACPFNYLYWDFYLRNQEVLRGNQRIGMAYQLLEKKSADELVEIRRASDAFRAAQRPNKYYL